MRLKTIKYGKLKNLGDYNNERLIVEVELNEGESEVEATNRAKKFVERHLAKSSKPFDVERAEGILRNPDDYTGNQVKDAKEKVAKWEAEHAEDSDEF